MSKSQIKVLRVASQREGFRRASFVFGRTPTDLPLDQLTKAARAAIEADPSLVALETEIEVDLADADGAAPAGSKPAAGTTAAKPAKK